MRKGRHHLVLLVAALALTGCPSEDDADDGAIPSGSTTGPPASVDSSSEGGESSSGGSVPALPQCRKSCDVPAMCCPGGAPGCPSSDYPNNYSCVDSICSTPECSGDGDCEDGFSCVTLEGLSQCLVTCGDGSDCSPAGANAECIGFLDDGSGYCLVSCVDNSILCGNALCDEDSGRCTCSSSEQCIVGFECV